MGEVVIVTDLGHFKAYRLVQNPLESPRLELIKEEDIIDAHGRLSEKLTDEAGRFGMGGERSSLKGYGEKHNLESEMEKKIIKSISREIIEIIKSENPERWHLSAAKTINNKILSYIDQGILRKLKKNIKADLTKLSKKELLGYFAG